MNNDRPIFGKFKKEIAELKDIIKEKDAQILEQAKAIDRERKVQNDLRELVQSKDESYDELNNQISVVVSSTVAEKVQLEQLKFVRKLKEKEANFDKQLKEKNVKLNKLLSDFKVKLGDGDAFIARVQEIEVSGFDDDGNDTTGGVWDLFDTIETIKESLLRSDKQLSMEREKVQKCLNEKVDLESEFRREVERSKENSTLDNLELFKLRQENEILKEQLTEYRENSDLTIEDDKNDEFKINVNKLNELTMGEQKEESLQQALFEEQKEE